MVDPDLVLRVLSVNQNPVLDLRIYDNWEKIQAELNTDKVEPEAIDNPSVCNP